MIDIQKQIDYWCRGATEEWELATHLLDESHIRHGLFLLHLTIEKVIKAHVCKTTADIPHKSHNLLRLADSAGVILSQHDRDFLGELSLFNIEGRYPDFDEVLPPSEEVKRIRQETERLYLWLLNQL